MADETNISYSYQTGAPSPAPKTGSGTSAKAPRPLYAFIDCERVSLANGGVLLIHKRSNAQLIVAPEVSVALASCTTFRPLAQHVRVLTNTIPQLAGQQADVMKVMEMVRDAGLFATAEETCRRISPEQAPQPTRLARTRVFIITCDRPQAVQRLVQSMLFAGNLAHHEEIVLVDDSRRPENAELNRQLVEQFNLTSPRNMHYVGSAAQQQLLESLVGQLPEHEKSIRFLIDRQRWAQYKSYGLARTLCLLLSVGKRAIVMDDDVICASVASPHSREGFEFGDTPREVEVYSSEQDILARTHKTATDPLTGHAQCLGLSLTEALAKLGSGTLQATDLAGANGAFLSQWHADTPVIITQSGSMGDPGTPDTSWIYTLDPKSIQRILASPGGLEGALQNRHYWMGQPRPTFTKMSVISQVIGLDNSRLLPPYFPVFRSEDYLFGAMVEYLHPQSTVLEYDWCVPHFPLEPRPGDAGVLPSTGKGRFNAGKFITDNTVYRSGIEPATRLQGLSQLLQEVSETSDQDLITRFRREAAESLNTDMQRITLSLQNGANLPQTWQARLQQGLDDLSRRINSPALPTGLPGIPAGYTDQAILKEFRAYTGEFSAALGAWEEIREAAKTGFSPDQPL